MRFNFVLFVFILLTSTASATEPDVVELSSPNGQIKLQFALKDAASFRNTPYYRVSFQNQTIILNSELAIDFKDTGLFKSKLSIKDITYEEKDESYATINGKTAIAQNHYSQVIIALVEKRKPRRHINVVFRAYNDGIAFRYVFPKQKHLDDSGFYLFYSCASVF